MNRQPLTHSAPRDHSLHVDALNYSAAQSPAPPLPHDPSKHIRALSSSLPQIPQPQPSRNRQGAVAAGVLTPLASDRQCPGLAQASAQIISDALNDQAPQFPAPQSHTPRPLPSRNRQGAVTAGMLIPSASAAQRNRERQRAAPTACTLIALALAASLLHADDLPTSRVGVGLTETKLTLAEAVEMSLKNNLEIDIERTNPIISRLSIKNALGAFDPTLHFDPSFLNNNTPTSSSLQGVNGLLAEKSTGEVLNLRWKTPYYGSSFGLDFDTNRFTTNSPFAGLSPYYTSRLVVNFTQPLLRDRAIDRERNELRIRRKNLAISELDFRLKVIDVVSRVEQGYWDLVAARQDVTVTSDAVNLASEQYSRDQRMINSGSLAPVELSAAKAELERRRDAYFASLGSLTEVENNLKSLLTPNRSASLWNDQVIPLDLKSPVSESVVDVKDAVTQALVKRPELKQLLLRQESNAYDQQFAADQTKPQINFVASYINQGLAGTINTAPNPFAAGFDPLYQRLNELSAAAGLPPISVVSTGSLPNSIVGGLGTTLSSVFGGNYQSASVGVSVDLTFRNRAAQSLSAQSAVTGRRLKLEQSRIELLVDVQVRNAVQAIQTARQRISAAESSEAAAKEKLESETRLFQTGESTNFLVLTRQSEYLDARRRTVVAHLESNRATARLEQALGSTLSTYRINLQ